MGASSLHWVAGSPLHWGMSPKLPRFPPLVTWPYLGPSHPRAGAVQAEPPLEPEGHYQSCCPSRSGWQALGDTLQRKPQSFSLPVGHSLVFILGAVGRAGRKHAQGACWMGPEATHAPWGAHARDPSRSHARCCASSDLRLSGQQLGGHWTCRLPPGMELWGGGLHYAGVPAISVRACWPPASHLSGFLALCGLWLSGLLCLRGGPCAGWPWSRACEWCQPGPLTGT